MKAKPILFSTPMVQALLDGKKTMTRRVVKNFKGIRNCIFDDSKIKNICPYGKVGDLLYVREKFTEEACATAICYAADFPIIWPANQTEQGEEIIQEAKDYKFKPSIFMPRKSSRLTLEITDIRVERLRDISEEDAMTEGVKTSPSHPKNINIMGAIAFKKLWQSINGKDSWEANPFVWVLEFKVHKINVDEFIKNAN